MANDPVCPSTLHSERLSGMKSVTCIVESKEPGDAPSLLLVNRREECSNIANSTHAADSMHVDFAHHSNVEGASWKKKAQLLADTLASFLEHCVEHACKRPRAAFRQSISPTTLMQVSLLCLASNLSLRALAMT